MLDLIGRNKLLLEADVLANEQFLNQKIFLS